MGYRRRARTITLKFAAKCRDCGADLAKGTTARWYGRGRVYGLTCHPDSRQATPTNAQLPPDAYEEGAQLEERLSDDIEAHENGPIPQTRMFD